MRTIKTHTRCFYQPLQRHLNQQQRESPSPPPRPTAKRTRVSGLPLASILRKSLGLPATIFRGSLGSFKGSSLIWNGSCAEIFCFAYDALCRCYNSVMGQFCQIISLLVVHFQVFWLVAYRSNRFIQRPALVVLHVSSTLVVGSPANSEDVL